MKTTVIVTIAAALAFASPAAAQQIFDFNGQATVPGAVGGTLDMNSVVYDPAPASTPLPLSFGAYQYTLVVRDLTLNLDGVTQAYSGGMIAIYEDASTPADPADPATYTDGVLVLGGVITSLNRTLFPGSLIGSISGFVDWTGGRDLDEFAPEDQDGWPLLSGFSVRAQNVAPGYDENWDGKTEPTQLVVENREMSWAQVKALY